MDNIQEEREQRIQKQIPQKKKKKKSMYSVDINLLPPLAVKRYYVAVVSD